jgi:BirA family biotin operon repressor/biotin-[acetyl-CoA-carboxylase] ligase
MSTAEHVLEILKGKEKVSGEAIAKDLNVSRTAVWKAINTLRETGYEIEGDAKGYRLVSVPDLMLPQEIDQLLTTRLMGRAIEHHYTIGSTNERARELAEQGRPEGTLVVSEEQRTGKGRIGRAWVSPKDGIWMSLVLRPELRPSETTVLTLAAGVAVAETLSKEGFEPTLKWPNDVLIDGKKVTGLLSELSGEMERVHYIIIGFGLNANFELAKLPKEIRSRTTTLLEERGVPVDRRKIIAYVMEAFEVLYEGPRDAIIEGWRKWSSTLGSKVRITTQGQTIEGTAKDIDGSGALVLELPSGEKTVIYSGDCEHLRRL